MVFLSEDMKHILNKTSFSAGFYSSCLTRAKAREEQAIMWILNSPSMSRAVVGLPPRPGREWGGRISPLHFIPLPRQTHPMHPPGCSVPVWKSGISSGLSWWCIFWAMVMVRKLRRRSVNIIFTLFLGGSDKVNHLNALLYPGCSEQSADQRISVI